MTDRLISSLISIPVLIIVCGIVPQNWVTPPTAVAAESSLHASLRRSAVVRAVESARPCIVNIHGKKMLPQSQGQYVSGGDASQPVRGMGTGVFVDERGYILTNYHVVQGVRRINVSLFDGRKKLARLIAHDPVTDLAIIKVPMETKAPLIRIGTSTDLMTGEEVIAVGNAFGYEHTVTRGIISALQRDVQVDDTQKYFDLIQTDASINPGNSGGPLLNIEGEMIGINAAVRVGAQNIGFAIPVDKAMAVATQLISARRLSGIVHGIVADTERDSIQSGITTLSVQTNSPAAAAGLQPGDVVTRVNGIRTDRALDLERALIGTRPGQSVAIDFRRAGQASQVALQLASANSVQPTNEAVAIDESAWSNLGLRLASLSSNEVREFAQIIERDEDSNYRFDGGLRVVDIRNGSSAAQQGIRPGDVLVGLHEWKVRSFSDVAYVLKEPKVKSNSSIKFYIVRRGDTLFGQLPVTWRR